MARRDPRRTPRPANLSPGPDPKPATPSAGPASACEPYRGSIEEKLAAGLTAQRIWQDLRMAGHIDLGAVVPLARPADSLTLLLWGIAGQGFLEPLNCQLQKLRAYTRQPRLAHLGSDSPEVVAGNGITYVLVHE